MLSSSFRVPAVTDNRCDARRRVTRFLFWYPCQVFGEL